jgi:hypothetical protein
MEEAMRRKGCGFERWDCEGRGCMTQDEFWALIDLVRKNAPDEPDGKYETLKTELGKLPLAGLQSFAKHFGECFIRAYTYELWGAAYIIGGGCGDDSFMDFRGTLIMQGKDFFEVAIADPDSLADTDYCEDNEINYPFYQGYGYVAQRLIEGKGGEMPVLDLPKKPSGYRWQEEELQRLYPKLFAKFEDYS